MATSRNPSRRSPRCCPRKPRPERRSCRSRCSTGSTSSRPAGALGHPAAAVARMEELSIALQHLQQFAPAGVGARAPGECLWLQLKKLKEHEPSDTVRRLAMDIAQNHLELLASRDYTRLKSATGADEEALRCAQRLIQALNPRPGAVFAKLEARYVVPDVIVRKSRNVWRASLNPDAMPRLRINRLYA